MAEISSLLGLITDDNTRQALIAQMENMFDNAPDEERLIQEIGNPTKVAVALIRYADSGKITPAAAPVLDGQLSFDEQPADDGYYDEQPEGDYDPNYATDGEEGYYDEAYYEDKPAYKTNVFLAILYTLGAIVVGVPVLAVLLVLDLAVLAVGAACGAGGVGLIATAFIGLPMVADMLILLGGGAAVIAIALVVIWLAIWLFIRMVIGWVRLLVRTGKRWCRKEIAA